MQIYSDGIRIQSKKTKRVFENLPIKKPCFFLNADTSNDFIGWTGVEGRQRPQKWRQEDVGFEGD